MKIHGFFAASIGACLAIAALALSPPLLETERIAEPFAVTSIETNTVLQDTMVLAIFLHSEDEPVPALAAGLVEPLPKPRREVERAAGLTPPPADRYLC